MTQATQLWRNFQQAVSQPIIIPAPTMPTIPPIPRPAPPPPPDMSGWQRTFQNVSNQAQEMGRKIQSVGQNMTTAFAPLAYASGKAFGSMIKNSMEFEQQTRKAAVLTGGVYGQVKKDILEMATSSVYSTGQVAAAYAELGAKGFEAAQATDALPGVLSAAAASGEDLGMVADTITSALNAFSMEAKDSGHVADVLAQAANATAAGVYDMQYAFKYAAGPAAQLGISMEELAASVGIMSNAGIKGETAGTALRSAMLRLVKPPKAAANMLKELGVTTTDSSGNMKSLSQIIGELQKGMDGMTSAQKGAALATIFGTEAVSGMMALVSAGPEKIDKLTQSLIKSDGASKKAADSMLEGWAGAIVKMQSSIDVAARAFTDALAPAISVVADVIKKLADGFNGLSPTMKTVIATVATAVSVFTVFMAVLGVFISSIGATITAFGALVGWLGKSAMVAKLASAAMVGLRAAFTFLTGPIGATIAILTLLGTALVQLYKHNEAFRNAVNSAWESIKTTTISAVESMKAAFGELGTTIMSLFGDVVKQVMPVAMDLFKLFGENIQLIMPMVTDLMKLFAETTIEIMPAITQVVQELSQMFSELAAEVMPMLSQVAQEVFPTILNVIQTSVGIWVMLIKTFGEILVIVAQEMIPVILSVVQEVFPIIQSIIETAIPIIIEIIKLFGEIITIIATTVVPLILQAVQEVFPVIQAIIQAVIPIISALLQGAAEIIKGVLIPAIQFILQIVQAVFPAVMGIIKSVIGIITNIIKLFTSILKGDWSGAWDAVKGITSNVMSLIKSIIDGAISLIGVIVRNGLNLVQSIFSSVLNAVWNVVKSIFDGIRNVISSVISAVGNIISAGWNAASSATSSILDAMSNAISNIWNNIISFLKGINLMDIGKNIMEGMLNGITSMASRIWDKVTEIGNGIKDKLTGLFSIHSPSRWMRDMIGVNMMQGWINGVDGMKSSVQRTTQQMSDWMKPEMLAVDTGASIPRGVNGLGVYRSAKPTPSMYKPSQYENQPSRNKEPANINIQIGKQEFARFVDDITGEQEAVKRRREVF
ncbi:phage tail tape measure protein [Bacillus cereus]|uniref:phage tail tape measure protein n=1 Tax=Bacillus cereus TaxID=1396 RepID=UPI002112F2FB|nr:phage tail tape measure protein [Bacillus cereus]